MPTIKEFEQMVKIFHVTFKLSCDEKITVESHVQDTLPSGSEVGTVVCMHGSPGSHKDFKYITPYLYDKGIRVVGINFPAYGLTQDHHLLRFDNIERNNYVKAIIDDMGIKDKLVIMGHSRGCENATGTASLLSDNLSGLVLLNPTGLRYNNGFRSGWIITLVLWLHGLNNFMANLIENLLHWFYNKVGLRMDSGKRAVACVKTMKNIELENMKPKIDIINNNKHAKVLQAYSGKDLFIDLDVSQELAESWYDHQEVICSEKTPEAAEIATKETINHFRNGIKSVSVNFTQEDHFLQKHQAKFVADAIEIMLKS